MRLFIRGAWRSFGDNPQNRPDRSGKSNLSESVSNGSERPLQSSFRQPKEGQDRPHDPFAPILTSYLPTLKAFYGLFGDSYPDAEDESSCSIRLDDCRYLVLTREKHGDRDAPLEKHPKVSHFPTTRRSYRTKPMWRSSICLSYQSIKLHLCICKRNPKGSFQYGLSSKIIGSRCTSWIPMETRSFSRHLS